MTVKRRAFSAGHFELSIDGHKSTTYLHKVEGGFAKAETINEKVGPDNARIKHTSVVEVEPISVDFGLSGARDIMAWIQGSWKKQFSRRSGSVVHANFDHNTAYEHTFREALITEVAFPTLDGNAKDPSTVKVKFLPEIVTGKPVNQGPQLTPNAIAKQKMWSNSAFRFNIDGMDSMRYTNKLEAFTIKQGVKKVYAGEMRFPELEPTSIEFPDLSGTIALAYAQPLLSWYEKSIVKGQADNKAQKTGSIEFLSPDRKSTLYQINLFDVGLKTAFVMPSTANQSEIKRVKFELYVGRMEMDGAAIGMG